MIDEKNVIAIQNFAMNSLYLDKCNYNDTLLRHIRAATLLTKQHALVKYSRPIALYETHQRKRVGIVSGDLFGDHPVTYFIYALLTEKFSFDIYGYSNSRVTNSPQYSKSIMWRDIKYLTLENVCELIQRDEIDILIDVSGYTSFSRMDVFCNRVAPIQLSYIGYPCPTGLPTIDYHLIDKTFEFGNKLRTYAMNGCFTHYTPFIDIENLPPIRTRTPKRPITFGTHNKPAKISKSTAELWDKLLDRLPEAILLIKGPDTSLFRNSDRVKVTEFAPTRKLHLARYNEIDVALDTFPYSGTTTTCEALLMGVPVITLTDRKGKTLHQNVSASLLINSGLEDFVCDSEEEFIQTCLETSIKVLSSPSGDYKKMVRSKFINGTVCDSKAYVRSVEMAIKDITCLG
jgi:predicted O-linked N-acetylglucosamine transferase (SPINDLY family)